MPRRTETRSPSITGPAGAEDGRPEPAAEEEQEIPEGEPSAGFLEELRANWARHGAQTIDKVRADRPHDYLRLIASALAKRSEEGSAVETLTDDEIADELQRILAALAVTGADPRA